GQITVTTPDVPARSDIGSGKAIFWNDRPNLRLFGYQVSPPRTGAADALAVGYGTAGAVGRDHPDAIAVAPAYVALRYCVKN
ncbi:MAG: hypothetical protein ACYC8V_13640, partial [Caulobacteraceae bacterium]